MLRIQKQTNNHFRVEEIFIEDNEEVCAFSIENLTTDDLRNFIRGRNIEEDSLEQGLQIVLLTKYPATFDSRGRLMGVIEGQA